MNGALTTHVLDVSNGCPAIGVRIDLFRLRDGKSELLRTERTNADGRVQGAMLSGESFVSGIYEFVFYVGDYFLQRGAELPEPAFLDQVPVRFGISSRDAHYHVPLLIAPWGYNTYRGS
jgi:5-hydroxyisourate hydrolase